MKIRTKVKDMRKAEGNKSILMYLAAGLLVIIISGLIVGGIYARYAATGGGNAESARVAKVKVEFTGQTSEPLDMNFKPTGDTAPASVDVYYKFKVNNASEVAMSYSLILELPDTLADIVPSIGSSTKAQTGNTYTFTDTAWVLAPGGVTDELTLTLTGTAANMTTGTYENIKFYVDAVQID